MKECTKCGGQMIDLLIDYERNIMGQKITIPNVEGYRCEKCGYEEIAPWVEKRLAVKVLKKQLEIQKDMPAEPITINKLKTVRKKKEIPQKLIGEAIGFTEQRFGAVERNENTPTVHLANQIASVMNVNVSDIYETLYIPRDFFLELLNMDSNFEIIEGLPELREEFQKWDDRHNVIKNEMRKIRSKARKIARETGKKVKDPMTLLPEETRKEFEQLIEENKMVLEQKEKLRKKMKPLKKRSILKQDRIIDADTWERIKEKFPDRITLY